MINPNLKFLTWQQVKEQEAYYARLEKQYWEEEMRKCIADPKYYFANYIKFINHFSNATNQHNN